MSSTASTAPPHSGRIFQLLLVDDHPIVLDGFRLMIQACGDLEVCATATQASEALELFLQKRPDLVLVDLNLRGRSGLDLIKDLVALDGAAKVLVCSMHDEMLYAERAFRAGARGYVTKDTAGSTVLQAIRRLLAGEIYMSERLAAAALQTFAGARIKGTHTPLEKLTDRELEIFERFGEGMTAKEIGALLNLSPKTVAAHRDNIKEKLEFATSAEMIRQAVCWVEYLQAGPRTKVGDQPPLADREGPSFTA